MPLMSVLSNSIHRWNNLWVHLKMPVFPLAKTDVCRLILTDIEQESDALTLTLARERKSCPVLRIPPAYLGCLMNNAANCIG